MKLLIVVLIAFTALISVEAAAQLPEVTALIAQKTPEYAKMTNEEKKAHIVTNVNDLAAMMKEASGWYRMVNLGLVADNYEIIESYCLGGMNKMFITLDNMTEPNRTINYIKWGVTVEVINYRGHMEKDRRQKDPLKVNDTLENIEKKWYDVCNRTLTLTKFVAEDLKVRSPFWSDFHEQILGFLIQFFKNTNERIKLLTPNEIKAKNYQLLVDDFELLMNVADTRPTEAATTPATTEATTPAPTEATTPATTEATTPAPTKPTTCPFANLPPQTVIKKVIETVKNVTNNIATNVKKAIDNLK